MFEGQAAANFEVVFSQELHLRQILRQMPFLVIAYQTNGMVRWSEGDPNLGPFVGLQSGAKLNKIFSQPEAEFLYSVFEGVQASHVFEWNGKNIQIHVKPHIAGSALAILTQISLPQPKAALESVSSERHAGLHLLNQAFERRECVFGQLKEIGGMLALLQYCAQMNLIGCLKVNTGKVYFEADTIVAIEAAQEFVQDNSILLGMMVEQAQGEFLLILNQRSRLKTLQVSIQAFALDNLYPLRGVHFDQPKYAIHDHFHSVHLPDVSALKAFLQGVGGSQHFLKTQEFDAATNGERLILYGRGFRVVVNKVDHHELQTLDLEDAQPIGRKKGIVYPKDNKYARV